MSADQKEYTTKELMQRFYPYYKNHTRVLAADLFCAFLTTLCEMVLPMIIRFITNTGMQDLAMLSVDVVGKMALLYLVLRVIDCMANYYMADMGHVMGAAIETDMRRDAYSHLQKLSNTYYNNTKVGQIMGRITNDLFDVTDFSHHFVILSSVNLPLTLAIFIIVPVMAYVCIKLNQRSRRAFAKQRVQIGELNASIEDSLLGQKVVKAFTNEPVEIDKFEKGNVKFYDIKKETYKYIAEQFQRGLTGIERFLQIMDADVEIFDEPGAKEMGVPKGDISFEDVSFEYPDDHNTVFRHLNLTVRAGEKLAIVGPSGGGKTTLCNLLPRFYDITDGVIRIDGEDIKAFTLKSLRKNIGIVQQDVYLFSGTVMENILYGNPDASREDAVEAAEKAGADAFIRELKDGYDTYVGERGVKLSGGQKQRISIARVFLKNPPIMILDEATSALDNESEFAVAQSLHHLSEGRTTITIAHRLSSIKNSDRILVLTDQGITEEGNHESLMAQKGTYYQFYTMAERLK